MNSLSENVDLAGGRLTIDLGALADNWRLLNQLSGASECSAVVKADAYGIGIEQAVPTLWKAGCRTFFVALPGEGVRVRKAAPDAIIYVLAGYLPRTFEIYRDHALRPVINDEINAWIEASGENNFPYAIQLETGMNRLGMPISDFEALRKSGLIASHQPDLVISHLACADTPDHPLNEQQRAEFQKIVDRYACKYTSLANSAGIFLGPDYHNDLVRPGIALYGGAAADEHLQNNPMRPVICVEARILQVKSVLPGASVGYGGVETIRPSDRPDGRERILATLSAGYSDGYLRSAGSSDKQPGACAAWRGVRVPLIGRVSMDLVTVDMTDHPDIDQLMGDKWQDEWIELIGPTVPLDEVACSAGTIGYELLTSLGTRYHRTYINDL
ncbi:alanine racemase [Pararhizobium sp. IMCC21322]|uniref:alanine racemase n=1 Tax=Pararhizobium sp. IMCC21322 TaxID=3067903 RepID=UPI00274151D1|nr:alanine racemase [Pararhizobium sp. IMCC21322]